jgi:hypothetical protein
MQHSTEEIARAYRLDFDNGEAHWDDPMPTDITSGVLGTKATCIISRASLLAWSLMNIPEVEVADLTWEGWIRVSIKTGVEFDETAFKAEVETILTGVKLVRSDQARDDYGLMLPLHRRQAPRGAYPRPPAGSAAPDQRQTAI